MATILVVADEPEILGLLILLLREKVYVALASVDGRTVRDLLAAPAVNLVIADVTMPRLDGVDLVRAMRARAELLGVPAILMSAGGRPAVDGIGDCVCAPAIRSE